LDNNNSFGHNQKHRDFITLFITVALSLTAIAFLEIAITDQNNNEGTNESASLHGHFHAELVDKDGNIKQTIDKDNLIVTNGFKGISKLVFNGNSGVSPSTYRYIALGTSSTAVASSDTALNTEVSAGGYSRQLTSSPSYSSSVTTLTGAFTGFSATINEAGVFDASSSGNMISHVLTGTITMGSSDTLNITYTFTVS